MDQSLMKLPIVESLIMSSPEPLTAGKIIDVIDGISVGDIEKAVASLNQMYIENNHSFRIRKIAGGYQIYIIENYARYVEELFTRRRSVRLTRAALETLAIVAYRQPVTKLDIEMIRGVASDSVIHTLLERRLITLAGRAESVGRPLLYRTTGEFLKFFNLVSIDDLPRMSEIEELLAAKDSESQPRLPLEDDTFPPSARSPLVADSETGHEAQEDNEIGSSDETRNEAIPEDIQASDKSADTDEESIELESVEEK
jgi:segregation and condensation protein B